MGNGHSRGSSDSLVYRIRYNDPSLTELGLTTSLDDELESVIQCLPRNRTITSAVLFGAFTSHVLQQTKWNQFVQALISVQSLRQVELLETSVPFDTLRQLLQKPTLETLAVTDGIQLGSVTAKAIAQLGASIQEQRQRGECQLLEFVWECKYSTILLHGQHSTTSRSICHLLDPLLSALGSLSSLTLLGLVNSNLDKLPLSPLMSPGTLFQFVSQHRSSLQILDLSGCGLMDEHFQALREALSPSSPTASSTEDPYCVLERLHLQRNLATIHGLEGNLLPLVKSNSSRRLRILVTDATGTPLQEQLELWLYWRQQVREPLGRNPTRRDLGRMVVRMSDGRPDILFLLLREYPEIYFL
jgi:hypothetical protein